MFTGLIVGLLLMNTIFYPTLTDQYININSLEIFTGYAVATLTLALVEKSNVSRWMSKINNKLVFPIMFFLTAGAISLEIVNYPNFILEKFSIFPYQLIYLLLVSGLILYTSTFGEKQKGSFKIQTLFLLILVVFYFIWTEHHLFFLDLVEEDSILEYGQFLLLLLSAWFAFKTSKQANKKLEKWMFLLLSIGLLFVSFEEISWGQRIIGFSTPEKIEQVNVQNEFNIHNLFGYDINQFMYMIVGIYGLFSRLFIDNCLPTQSKRLRIFTPPTDLWPYFLIVFLVYYDRSFTNLNYDTVVENTFRKYAIWQWLEVAEMYLAIAFLSYTVTTTKELTKVST